MGNLNFNASDVPPAEAFDPIPPGWYLTNIVAAEIKVSEKAGEMVAITFEVDANAHPQYANRKLFTNLCINHPNSEQARDIARRSLSAIAHAIGKPLLADTDDLLGGSLLVKAKAVPPKDGYDAKNECSGFKAIDEQGAAPATAAAPKAAPAAASAPAGRPGWKR